MMPRPRKHATDADRQAAYRARLRAETATVERGALEALGARLERLQAAVEAAARAGDPEAQRDGDAPELVGPADGEGVEPMDVENAFRAFMTDQAKVEDPAAGPNPFRFLLLVLEEGNVKERARALELWNSLKTGYEVAMKVTPKRTGHVVEQVFEPRLREFMVWAQERVRTCPECGTAFFSTDPRKQYDTRDCAHRAGERRRYAQRKSDTNLTSKRVGAMMVQ